MRDVLLPSFMVRLSGGLWSPPASPPSGAARGDVLLNHTSLANSPGSRMLAKERVHVRVRVAPRASGAVTAGVGVKAWLERRRRDGKGVRISPAIMYSLIPKAWAGCRVPAVGSSMALYCLCAVNVVQMGLGMLLVLGDGRLLPRKMRRGDCLDVDDDVAWHLACDTAK